MAAHIYNWKRFWNPRAGQIDLADGGYLPDPDGEWTRFYNPELVPFESLLEIRCLGLLGEAGIGKSFALDALRAGLEPKIQVLGDAVIWIDLHEYGSEDRLVRELFESPTYTAWLAGSHNLHVFLDSLDECLMRLGTVAAVLESKLLNSPRERLYLRIACRTADWPNSLEEALRGYWGEQDAKVYELAPLRRVDVSEAASNRGVDPDDFIQAVERSGAVPLAIRPITLQFLLNTFGESGQLPSSQSELYLKGCQRLCEESNEGRRDTGLVGALSPSQRLAVAGRIAAVTLFANRGALWLGAEGDSPEADVPVAGLSGGTVRVDGDNLEVTQGAVREALRTGLFSSRGPNRLGWAHRTYAEFLAALHVVQQKMTFRQITSLFVHPSDAERKLVPQLRGAAAWLAGMQPMFFRYALKTDPDVLLMSDVRLSDEASRAALVESFLGVLDERKIQHPGFVPHQLYRKFAHAGLAAQLRLFIHEPSRSLTCRQVAIDIASACEVEAVQGDLAGIALDQAQPLQLRVVAAYSVARSGDSAVRSRMVPLAAGQAGEDPGDELKGCGLRAVWPEHLTASQLFSLLTPPKGSGLYGAYRDFLRKRLVGHLKPQDLPLALAWIKDQVDKGAFGDHFERLGDQIMLRAWERFDSREVTRPFAEAAALTLGRHYGVGGGGVEEAISRDKSKRRALIRAVLPLYKDTSEAVVSLCFGRMPIVSSQDVLWMIDELRVSQAEETRSLWARLIFRLFDGRDLDQVDAIITASQQEPAIQAEFSALLRPVALDSPEAQKMKQDYVDWNRLDQERRQTHRAVVVPPPQERVAACLDRFESGDVSAWWQLNLEMTLEPDSSYYGSDMELELREMPGWKAASDTTRSRVVSAAKQYLTVADPGAPTWLGTKTWHRPAAAGYRALRLLLVEEPAFVESIEPDIWDKWAQTILAHLPPVDSEPNDLDAELLKRSYSNSPDLVIEALMKLIDKENKEHKYIFITRAVRRCWDGRLATALSAKAKDQELDPVAMGCLLENLLDHDVADARIYAESLVQAPPPPENEGRNRSVVAAKTLLTHAQDAGWEVLHGVFQSDTAFGREVFLRVGTDVGDNVSARLTDPQLGELYVWLAKEFPPNEDPQIEGAHAVGPREMLGHFRDGVLANLKSRGTAQSCEAIERIARELPGLERLSWTLADARAIARQRTWVPPKPQEIIELARDSHARLVQSGDQLLEVLIESLGRLQEKFVGETPRCRFLWNQCPSGKWRPKEEESLSDYIKGHLEDDIRERGIVLGREVQIRRRADAKPGEKTDILVTAVRMNPSGDIYDSVSAVIEVKGCWYREISRAMKRQLVDRYLMDNQCHHGLYVVGWFDQHSWDKGDARRRRAPKCSKNQAEKRLASQAYKLSKNGLLIRSFLLDVSLR